MRKEFKAFDRVLVIDSHNKWQIDLYAYWDEENKNHHTMNFGGCLDISDDKILPYEGNEHLVGTTDEPDEEVRLDYWEWIMVSSLEEPSDEPSAWYIEQINHISGKETIETKRGGRYCHFIRFSDFNPNDMEETKKHILCVRNGRIVKYKG